MNYKISFRLVSKDKEYVHLTFKNTEDGMEYPLSYKIKNSTIFMSSESGLKRMLHLFEDEKFKAVLTFDNIFIYCAVARFIFVYKNEIDFSDEETIYILPTDDKELKDLTDACQNYFIDSLDYSGIESLPFYNDWTFMRFEITDITSKTVQCKYGIDTMELTEEISFSRTLSLDKLADCKCKSTHKKVKEITCTKSVELDNLITPYKSQAAYIVLKYLDKVIEKKDFCYFSPTPDMEDTANVYLKQILQAFRNE